MQLKSTFTLYCWGYYTGLYQLFYFIMKCAIQFSVKWLKLHVLKLLHSAIYSVQPICVCVHIRTGLEVQGCPLVREMGILVRTSRIIYSVVRLTTTKFETRQPFFIHLFAIFIDILLPRRILLGATILGACYFRFHIQVPELNENDSKFARHRCQMVYMWCIV